MSMNSEENVNDSVLLHQKGEATSSIGPKWPPKRFTHDRFKGIFTPGIIGGQQDFMVDFFRVFRELADSESFGQNSDNGYTRISLRAVLTNSLLVDLPNEARRFVEAIIPLSGTQPVFSDCSLVYFGKNHSLRTPDAHQLSQITQNLNLAYSKTAKNPQEMIAKPLNLGYKIGILNKEEQTHQQKVKEIFALIQRFGYSYSDTKDLIDNPKNIVGIAKKEERIVAIGIAETDQIPIGQEILTIVELTEAAADRNHLGKGLYSGISTLLNYHLTKRSQQQGFEGREVDLIFGECNGASPGVLITARYQGRTFATETGSFFGYPNSGMLPLHVPILDPDENVSQFEITKNNNLFPAFLTRQSLYQLYSIKK